MLGSLLYFGSCFDHAYNTALSPKGSKYPIIRYLGFGK